MTESPQQAFVDGLADFFATGARTPILRRPDELGLAYEDVFFPSMDGVTLEGWFIPAASDRLVICNHFMPGNRYGYPGHLEPWTNAGGFEVNFLPQYKALNDAGYNVLTYDLRNHGLSNTGSGGIVGIGLLEYRDVIGSLRYAGTRPDTAGMKTALLSVCLGANSTMVAMHKHPEEFSRVQTMIALQPTATRPIVERAAEGLGLEPVAAAEAFDEAIQRRTGFRLDELSPLNHAQAVRIPTLLAQVRADTTTKIEVVQQIFDNIAATDKELHWIEGTDLRFQGYNYFGRRPEVMIDWFDQKMN
ncbi:hypothetical protein AWB85_00085 [Mycobacteroides immunogenum]|uniref:Alpha/beta hydrolase n=1 Tax=Mycobacteroides immunogenum TaxID=83262 RepID=A0A179VGC5_9MYCO|nr:hypothetical protein [Mycobacteroides immunogenum]OAT70978.1 hypothetical protein AWB85_00085 [Mycobacteroides immunogenum]